MADQPTTAHIDDLEKPTLITLELYTGESVTLRISSNDGGRAIDVQEEIYSRQKVNRVDARQER